MKRKTKEKPVSTEPCAASGCREPGEFKAPLSRYDTAHHQYLCLAHIREFNLAWDYFDGWNREQIESFMHSAVHGHRPTWTISSRVGGDPLFFTSETLRDSFFRMLGETPPPESRKPQPHISRKEREALATLDLEPGAPFEAVKAQYKKLVKKYHPDVNRGNKHSEETFKQITAAYAVLTTLYGKSHET